MNERLKVKLSIFLWLAVAAAFVYCGIYVYNNMDAVSQEQAMKETPIIASVAPESVGFDAQRLSHIEYLVEDGAEPLNGVNGLAVAIVRDGKLLYNYAYGSLANGGGVVLHGMGNMAMGIILMRSVEMGIASLDDVAINMECCEHPYDFMDVTSDDVDALLMTPLGLHSAKVCGAWYSDLQIDMESLSAIVAHLVGDAAESNASILSRAGINALLTPLFGWHRPAYSSLVDASAVEFCGDNASVIIDVTHNVGVVVVADVDETIFDDGFTYLRSRIASIVASAIVE